MATMSSSSGTNKNSHVTSLIPLSAKQEGRYCSSSSLTLWALSNLPPRAFDGWLAAPTSAADQPTTSASLRFSYGSVGKQHTGAPPRAHRPHWAEPGQSAAPPFRWLRPSFGPAPCSQRAPDWLLSSPRPPGGAELCAARCWPAAGGQRPGGQAGSELQPAAAGSKPARTSGSE